VEQGHHLLLELVELRLEDRDETPSLLEPVSLRRHEQVEDALRAGGTALEFLGVDRQHLDLLARHGATDLALEQSLDEERDEVREEQRLDAGDLLAVDRRDILDALERFVALLEARLELVRLENLARRQILGVGDQRGTSRRCGSPVRSLRDAS